MEDLKTINITLKIDVHNLGNFEDWLRQNLEVIDLKILPNTDQLYSEDDHFKNLVKGVKDAQRLRDRYINEHNFKSA